MSTTNYRTAEGLEASTPGTVVYVGPVPYRRTSSGWRRFDEATMKAFGRVVTSQELAEIGARS